MHSHVDRKSEKGRTTANLQPEGKSHGGSTFQFVDNRPEAIAQRKLQEAANNSPQVRQMKALHEAANNGPRVQQLVASPGRAGLGRTSTVQRKEKGEAQGHSSHASNSPVAQRESYFDLREVDDHYKKERKEQRGDLRDAVKMNANQVKLFRKILKKLGRFKKGEISLEEATKEIPEGLKSEGKDVKKMDDADKISEIIQKSYHSKLEFCRLQDIPIDDYGELDWDALDKRLVTYDETPEAQAKTKVDISGGTLKRSATHDSNPGEAVDTSSSVTQHTGKGWEIFVMSPSGDLHMASHKIGKYHHSSLLAGISVAGAGTIQAAGGQIMVLNDKSGHYQPTKQQTLQVCHMLKKKGVDLSKVQLDLPFSTKYKGPADQFLTEGQENSLEKDMTQKTVEFFVNTRGESQVRDAFKDLGWVLSGGRGGYVVRKGDRAEASPQEVRDVLNGHFAKVAKPNDKKGDRKNSYLKSTNQDNSIYLNEDSGQYLAQDGGTYLNEDSGQYLAQDGGTYLNEDSGQYLTQDGGTYLNEDNGQYITQDGGTYLNDDNGQYITQDGGTYLNDDNGQYLAQDSGTYLNEDNGQYLAHDNRKDSGSYISQDNRKDSGNYVNQDNNVKKMGKVRKIKKKVANMGKKVKKKVGKMGKKVRNKFMKPKPK